MRKLFDRLLDEHDPHFGISTFLVSGLFAIIAGLIAFFAIE